MTKTEARSGKRYRLLESRRKVAQGPTEPGSRARREGVVSQLMPDGNGGQIPVPTVEVWTLDIQCDDPLLS
jgi:hypothetical protein